MPGSVFPGASVRGGGEVDCRQRRTTREGGVAAERESGQRREGHQRVHAWEGALAASGADQGRRRCDPKGRRCGSPLLDR